MFQLTNLAAGILSGLLITNPGFMVLGVFYFIGMFLISGEGDGKKVYRYDDLKIRYLRIKEQAIERLKDKNLKASDKKQLLEDIEYMQKIIDRTVVFKSIVDRLYNLLPSNKKIRNDVELQRQLEMLNANDLFIGASKLAITHNT